MYAFNKRFRPSEFKGLLIGTWLTGATGALLIAFCGMAVFSARNYAAALVLFFLGSICIYFAYQIQSKKSRMRLSPSEFIGRVSDIKSKVLYK